MTAMTLRLCLETTDPRVRFRLPDGSVFTAGELSGMRSIPGDLKAPIYGIYEDDKGYAYIGIAPGSPDIDIGAWIDDQIQYPIMKSIDRVDIIGNLIEDALGGGQ